MGIETAALVMAVVAAGAQAGKAGVEIQAADERERALELQTKQLEIQTQQKTLQNYDAMEKVVAAQAAHMTTTGLAFSSSSFNAIQRNTLNIGAKRQRNISLEDEIAHENIATEKRNVRNTLFAQLFGDVSAAAQGAASIAAKVPKVQGE